MAELSHTIGFPPFCVIKLCACWVC